MKRLQLFAYLFPFLASLLVGCRSSEPFDNITRAATPKAFNYVTPAAGARVAAAVCNDVSYYIVFDDDNRTANITISNLRTPASTSPATLTFKDCEMTYTSNNHSKERIVRADVLVSNSPVGEGTVITDATFIYTESNALDPNGIDGIYARFTIDGLYTVTAYPYHVFADGTTRIDNVTHQTSVIDYKPVYTIDINPDDMTASLKVYGLDLGENLPAITISNLQFVLTDNGYCLDATSSSVLAMAEGGYGDMQLEALTATALLRDELRIDMRLKFNGEVYRISAFTSSNLSK